MEQKKIIEKKNGWEFSKTNKWHKLRSPKTPSRLSMKKLHLGTTVKIMKKKIKRKAGK